ncbi:hypothetical protein MG293_011154 [Ovis ammon polii]|uniref:Uncharacterized protein n=1 Tax=Ovis ammon polii TaxID=230172 RepID=A0AAD4Y994_OVIAM|nr:hypothetical protein MG293_011154 [Ovis ammon polii]
MKTPTQLGFELDYQETQSMEYARHPFDALLTYETWLENKALITLEGDVNPRKICFFSASTACPSRNYSARIAIKRPSDSSFYPQGGPESGSSDTNEETFASGPERKAASLVCLFIVRALDTFHGRPALTQRSWPFTWALFRQLLQLCAASRALPAVSACIAPQ